MMATWRGTAGASGTAVVELLKIINPVDKDAMSKIGGRDDSAPPYPATGNCPG
jgi:hypothetical protein